MFKYLVVTFTSDGRQGEELDTLIGKAIAVMQALKSSVVMKRELSKKTKLSVFKAVLVFILTYGHESWVMTRGGVEDTRLEAKDSLSEDRHSRGQGQECSRPRPRTKDTSASALQKKKGLHKNFSSDLHKKTFSKIFFKRFTKF